MPSSLSLRRLFTPFQLFIHLPTLLLGQSWGHSCSFCAGEQQSALFVYSPKLVQPEKAQNFYGTLGQINSLR